MPAGRSLRGSLIEVTATTVGQHRFAELADDGPPLDSEQAALDLIGEAWGVEADMIVIPKSRLAPAFFDLRSNLLGHVTQKFVNYGVSVGFVGDFSAELAASGAFRDYVFETNKGRTMLFAADLSGLEKLILANS